MRTANPSPMLLLILAFIAIPALSGCRGSEAARAAPHAQVEADEREIGAMFGRLAQATTVRDFEAFGTELTDDWSYFTSGGSVVDLEGFRAMISGWSELAVEIGGVRAHLGVDRRVAWATFEGRLRGEAGGERAERRLRFTAIVMRAGEEWKLRHLQSTVATPS